MPGGAVYGTFSRTARRNYMTNYFRSILRCLLRHAHATCRKSECVLTTYILKFII